VQSGSLLSVTNAPAGEGSLQVKLEEPAADVQSGFSIMPGVQSSVMGEQVKYGHSIRLHSAKMVRLFSIAFLLAIDLNLVQASWLYVSDSPPASLPKQSPYVERTYDVWGHYNPSTFVMAPFAYAQPVLDNKPLAPRVRAGDMISLCHSDSGMLLGTTDGEVVLKEDDPEDISDDLDQLWLILKVRGGETLARGGDVMYAESIQLRHLVRAADVTFQ